MKPGFFERAWPMIAWAVVYLVIIGVAWGELRTEVNARPTSQEVYRDYVPRREMDLQAAELKACISKMENSMTRLDTKTDAMSDQLSRIETILRRSR